MELFEFKVELPFQSAEAVDSLLLEAELQGWNVLEDVIQKRAWLIGIFEERSIGQDQWEQLKVQLPESPLSALETKVLADQDWKDSYKTHFKPTRFGPLHWVPIWEKSSYVLPEGEVAIWLDPGLAFGTGNHETTRLCAERLVTRFNTLTPEQVASTRVIDAGCGSGILALSAARLGFRSISAFDNDPEAIRISRENQSLNLLDEKVEFNVGDLISGLTARQGDIVMANIQADVLSAYASNLVAAISPGGILVLSGILAHENSVVREKFSALTSGWTVESRVMGEWSDILFVRPGI